MIFFRYLWVYYSCVTISFITCSRSNSILVFILFSVNILYLTSQKMILLSAAPVARTRGFSFDQVHVKTSPSCPRRVWLNIIVSEMLPAWTIIISILYEYKTYFMFKVKVKVFLWLLLVNISILEIFYV